MRTGGTDHPQLLAIQHARLINTLSGGAVIAPWEIDQLEDGWLDAFKGLNGLPALAKEYQAFEKRLIEIRRQHPSYRKYLS